MNLPEGMERVFSKQQIEDLLTEALQIVEYVEPPEDLKQATFATTITLIGQMKVSNNPSTIAIPNLHTEQKKLL